MTDEDKGWLAAFDLLAAADIVTTRYMTAPYGYSPRSSTSNNLDVIDRLWHSLPESAGGKITDADRLARMNAVAIAFAKHYCESKND